jgi:hypothetical protein
MICGFGGGADDGSLEEREVGSSIYSLWKLTSQELRICTSSLRFILYLIGFGFDLKPGATPSETSLEPSHSEPNELPKPS